MSDALRANFERGPYRFRPHRLACVSGQAQARAFRKLVDFAEPCGRTALFVAADAEGHHAVIYARGRQLHDFDGVRHAEVADRVEYPVHFDGKFGRRLSHGSVDGREFLLLPEDDAGREGDFGVLDVIGDELLQQGARDVGVVCRGAQTFDDGFVCLDELLEIAECGTWRGRRWY